MVWNSWTIFTWGITWLLISVVYQSYSLFCICLRPQPVSSVFRLWTSTSFAPPLLVSLSLGKPACVAAHMSALLIHLQSLEKNVLHQFRCWHPGPILVTAILSSSTWTVQFLPHFCEGLFQTTKAFWRCKVKGRHIKLLQSNKKGKKNNYYVLICLKCL